MYDILAITFGVGIWTTIVLLVSLIVSKSLIIFLFILINSAVFVFFVSSKIKQFQVMKNLGSKIITGICWARSCGFDII